MRTVHFGGGRGRWFDPACALCRRCPCNSLIDAGRAVRFTFQHGLAVAAKRPAAACACGCGVAFRMVIAFQCILAFSLLLKCQPRTVDVGVAADIMRLRAFCRVFSSPAGTCCPSSLCLSVTFRRTDGARRSAATSAGRLVSACARACAPGIRV